jgi:hypothetical protein
MNLAAPASYLEMFHQLLTFALLGVPVVSAAPVHPYPSTSEPTKVTVMAKPTVAIPTPISTIAANLQARQWEWSPSALAWSEPVWTQPAWSAPAVVSASMEPVWAPSMSYSYTEVSTHAPTSTSSWIETHRPNASATKTGWITGLCVLAGIIGLGLIWYLCTMFRKYLHKRAPVPPSHNASDVEANAVPHRSPPVPAPDTPPSPATGSITEPSVGFHTISIQSQDLADTRRLPDPLNGLTCGPRSLLSVYQNKIPPPRKRIGRSARRNSIRRGHVEPGIANLE